MTKELEAAYATDSSQDLSDEVLLVREPARKSMSNYLKGKKEQKGKTKDGLVRKDMANDGLIDQESDGKKGANSVDLKDAICDYIQEHSKGVVYEASALCEIKDFDKHACLKILREYSTSLQSNEAVETLRKRVLRDRADLLDITPSPKVVHQGKTLRILEHL
ncbi:hypothetical protein BGW38_009491 [Lunasporangiospora selenospora]|uniref:Uncharacterized protein n=1 Tax=Lunasporangiospora selenospora TaxID=979761 RepID=A0A9P6KFX9_9FUNG|nr:hypothetical protein BGW38_009491 [Lunasporangiospora selenospora]